MEVSQSQPSATSIYLFFPHIIVTTDKKQVWDFKFPKSICAFKIVCLHTHALFWKELKAANRATVRVKGDNINEKAPSMQQGLCKCGWGVRVTGGCRERQSRNPAVFPPHVLKYRLTMFFCPCWNIK